MAFLIGEEENGGKFAAGVRTIDDADESVLGEDHHVFAHTFVGAGVDLDRLPPGGGVAAGDMGGDDMEAGGLFEAERFAQFVVFRFEGLEAGFDEC